MFPKGRKTAGSSPQGTRAVGILRDTHSLVSFHHKAVDEFDDVHGRIRKYDLKEALQHFQVCVECDLWVCGRAVFRKYLIDMERVDAPFLCVAHVDDIACKVSCERQILGFGV